MFEVTCTVCDGASGIELIPHVIPLTPLLTLAWMHELFYCYAVSRAPPVVRDQCNASDLTDSNEVTWHQA